MTNKIVLITGGTNGIGKETALALAKLGYQIVLTSRSLTKGEEVKQALIDQSGNSNIDVMECDLSSFESIKKFAANFKEKYKTLNILVNNAGVWETSRKETKDGIEMIFGVNHLASFLLTNLLLDTIKNSAPARIINVSSNLHNGTINFEDLEGKKSFNAFKAYNQSKLANILFTKKLAEILKGTSVTVNALHPGIVKTGLAKNTNLFIRWLLGFFQIDSAEGAKTTIYLASSPEVDNISGEYFVKSKIASSGPQSDDSNLADKLWGVSKRYVKI